MLAAAWLARSQNESDAAAALLAEALTNAQSAGDSDATAMALQGMGQVELQRGNFDRAATLTVDALDLARRSETGDDAESPFVSLVCANLGQIALARGDLLTATAYLEDALRQQRVLGFAWGMGDTLRYLGDLAREAGDVQRAIACYQESLGLAQTHGDRRFLAETLVGIAILCANRGQAIHAARLYGAAATLHEQVGAPVEDWERPAHDRGLALAQAALSPEAFAGAWADGAVLPPMTIATGALAAVNPSGLADQIDPGEVSALPAGLTPREREVLLLLAGGLTDREIAEALFISPRTVGGHVTNLLGKLGVDSRTAAAAWAVRNGLA